LNNAPPPSCSGMRHASRSDKMLHIFL
jgi:hypothetical protein